MYLAYYTTCFDELLYFTTDHSLYICSLFWFSCDD